MAARLAPINERDRPFPAFADIVKGIRGLVGFAANLWVMWVRGSRRWQRRWALRLPIIPLMLTATLRGDVLAAFTGQRDH